MLAGAASGPRAFFQEAAIQFLFNLLNHSLKGQESIKDVIDIVGQQLRALGHEAVWEQANDKFLTSDSGMNVIVEGFTPEIVRVVSEMHQAGARFVILATEEPTPAGFNHGQSPEMIARQKMFPEAARFAEAIVYLVPGRHVHDWYSQFAPSAHSELGYAPALVRGGNFEPSYEFGFFGSGTPRRKKIIYRLARTVCTGNPRAVRVETGFPDQVTRDRVMREAKVIIQIRKDDKMGLVSSSRCNTALCIGRPVVAEPHDLSKPWDEIVAFAQTMEGFYNVCAVVRARWRDVHEQQFERFKRMLTPEACIGRALHEVGVLAHPQGRATEADAVSRETRRLAS